MLISRPYHKYHYQKIKIASPNELSHDRKIQITNMKESMKEWERMVKMGRLLSGVALQTFFYFSLDSCTTPPHLAPYTKALRGAALKHVVSFALDGIQASPSHK